MTKIRALEYTFRLMAANMRGSGIKTRWKAMVNTFGAMADHFKDSTRMIKSMVSAFILSQRVNNSKDIGTKERRMG